MAEDAACSAGGFLLGKGCYSNSKSSAKCHWAAAEKQEGSSDQAGAGGGSPGDGRKALVEWAVLGRLAEALSCSGAARGLAQCGRQAIRRRSFMKGKQNLGRHCVALKKWQKSPSKHFTSNACKKPSSSKSSSAGNKNVRF